MVTTMRLRIVEWTTTARGEDATQTDVMLRHPRDARVTTSKLDTPIGEFNELSLRERASYRADRVPGADRIRVFLNGRLFRTITPDDLRKVGSRTVLWGRQSRVVRRPGQRASGGGRGATP